jgi:hypothetical protein
MCEPESGRIILVHQFEKGGDHWNTHELYTDKLFRVMPYSQSAGIRLRFCKYKDEKAAGTYGTSNHYLTWYSIANWEYFE